MFECLIPPLSRPRCGGRQVEACGCPFPSCARARFPVAQRVLRARATRRVTRRGDAPNKAHRGMCGNSVQMVLSPRTSTNAGAATARPKRATPLSPHPGVGKTQTQQTSNHERRPAGLKHLIKRRKRK